MTEGHVDDRVRLYVLVLHDALLLSMYHIIDADLGRLQASFRDAQPFSRGC